MGLFQPSLAARRATSSSALAGVRRPPRWCIMLLCFCFTVGGSSSQDTVIVNPVLDAPGLGVAVGSGTDEEEVDVRWSGGGHLQRWSTMGDGWEVVAKESPHVEAKGESALFRIADPWSRRRRVRVQVPSTYDADMPLPFVVLVHGFTSSGANDNGRFQLAPLAESRGFLYAYPDGSRDLQSRQFWNATDACCNEAKLEVDDSGFLRGLIEAVRAQFSVDPRRIYIIGHSNGGFMAYRMACDHSDVIAGVVSVAGAMVFDASKCNPTHPVHVLQIHGSSDSVININGGRFFARYPSARQSVMFWGSRYGHDTIETDTEKTMDLDLAVRGVDTTVSRLAGGAGDAPSVELWTIDRGGHVPRIHDAGRGETSEFPARVIDWLLAHPKP